MGEIADLIIEGAMCPRCSAYFSEEHGFPVLCKECFDKETEEERAGTQRALFDTM